MPRRPGASWTRSLELIGRTRCLHRRQRHRFAASDHAARRLRPRELFHDRSAAPEKASVLLSANWIRSSYYERNNPAKLNASLGSAFVNITGTPSISDEIRAIGWFQGTRDAAPNHFVLQSTGSGAAKHRAAPAGRVAAPARRRRRRARVRVVHSEPAHQRSRGPAVHHRRAAERRSGRRAAPARRRHRSHVVRGRALLTGRRARTRFLSGVDLAGGSTSVQSVFAGRVGELVNGLRRASGTSPIRPATRSGVSDRLRVCRATPSRSRRA